MDYETIFKPSGDWNKNVVGEKIEIKMKQSKTDVQTDKCIRDVYLVAPYLETGVKIAAEKKIKMLQTNMEKTDRNIKYMHGGNKRDIYVSRQTKATKPYLLCDTYLYIQFIESHMRLDSKRK